MSKDVKGKILKNMDRFLVEAPETPFGTRLKRMEHIDIPEYRLRIGDYRVYYRLEDKTVWIMMVCHEKKADRFLRRFS